MLGLRAIGCFAAGVLFGTAGVKALSSKDAKKVYVKSTAAALNFAKTQCFQGVVETDPHTKV